MHICAGADQFPGRNPILIEITTVDIKNPVLSYCWNDYLSQSLKYKQGRHVTTSLSTATQYVSDSYGINTSIPLIIRCDGRTIIPMESRFILPFTTKHPETVISTVSTIQWAWKPDASCSPLKRADCMERTKEYEAIRSSFIASVYSKFWPSVPKLTANNSATTIVVPRNGGNDGIGGLPGEIRFLTSFMDLDFCPAESPEILKCPPRQEIQNCRLVAPTMTVFYWPTSSVGNFCGAKTGVPNPMTISGKPNTAVIDVKSRPGDLAVKTILTSPSALVILPGLRREVKTIPSRNDQKAQEWAFCNSNWYTSATMQLHPDELSSIIPHYISTSAHWTKNLDHSTSVYETLYRQEMKTESLDFAAIHNPAWLKGHFFDNPAECGQTWGDALYPSDLATTITEPQVESMREYNCKMRILFPHDVPALAVPWQPLLKMLDRDWVNLGGNQEDMEEPFCKPEHEKMWPWYVPITEATITDDIPTGLPRLPGTTLTVTTVPSGYD
jgi:hypothetical protein